MAVLPTHAVYDANRLAGAELDAAKDAWRQRLLGVFDETPIPFRRQNGGDYPDGHTLDAQVAAGAEDWTRISPADGEAAAHAYCIAAVSALRCRPFFHHAAKETIMRHTASFLAERAQA